MINKYSVFGLVSISLLSLGLVFISNSPASASVQRSSEYHATSTKNALFASMAPLTVLQSGPSTVGSVVITGAAAGTINIFDATTSDVTKRAAGKSTSTLQFINLPNSTAAGTYTFDAVFFDGILVELTGTTPTSTITWR